MSNQRPMAPRPPSVGIYFSVRKSLFAMAMVLACTAAQAVDGCKAMLCLAAPNWSAIPMCAVVIRELFRDLARGRAFPSCAMSGDANAANHQWALPPDFCPVQYTRKEELESGVRYTCDFAGAVSVFVNGMLFTRTWWSTNGDSVTEFTDAAKTSLGRWDPRFDNDLAAWKASQG